MVIGTYSIPNNFLMGLTQIKENNLTGSAQVVRSYISGNASTYDNFPHTISSVSFREPIKVEGGRIHIDESRMETDKPYAVQYGKGTFVIKKDLKDKIHVYRLP